MKHYRIQLKTSHKNDLDVDQVACFPEDHTHPFIAINHEDDGGYIIIPNEQGSVDFCEFTLCDAITITEISADEHDKLAGILQD